MTSTSIRDLEPPPHIIDIQHFTSFNDVDEILRSKSFIQGSHQESQVFFGDSILTIDHERHFERRRLEAPLFRKEALEYYEKGELLPLIKRALDECSRERDENGLVRAELCSLLRTMLARISAVTTGIDGVDSFERTEKFREYIEQLGTGATVEWSTEDHDLVIERIMKVRDEFCKDFYDSSVKRRQKLIQQFRQGEVSEETLPRDLLTMLYLHWNDDWDDELPLREAALYLVASSQTTTHAVPHLIMHLSEWFQDHPEDQTKTANRDFLKQAAHETLRLHLPAPALLRIALQDVTLESGATITKGERVACLFTPANRDTKVFGETARTFDPYRETPDVKPWGFAFGGGEHTCIGRTLVTGLSARTDGDDGTDGTVVNIASALYEAGIELIPDDPPTYTDMSYHDAYGRFPIILRNL